MSEAGMTMTLEQVRDWHRQWAKDSNIRGEYLIHIAMADAIDAHLTTPPEIPVSAGEAVAVFSIDHTHKNQSHVTLGFTDDARCLAFIKALQRDHVVIQQPPPAGFRVVPVEETDGVPTGGFLLA